MAPRSCARRNPCNNPLADLTGEQNELAGSQSPAGKPDTGSNKASTPFKAPTSFKALIPSLVPLIKDLFTKFMKTFVESTQA